MVSHFFMCYQVFNGCKCIVMKVVEQSERILVQFDAACHVAEFVEAATWCAMQDWNCWSCCRLFVQVMECKV